MKTPEALLIRVINALAETFKDQLVLKGGMLLRLYQSPRFTQDVDFVWISEESKKILKPQLLQALEKMGDIQVKRTDVNSRGIFLEVTDGKETALIEISVLPAMGLPVEPLSTALLGRPYSLSGRIVSTMALPEAFSHKIAASLEREAMRDLFDLSQLEAMGPFDRKVLKQRLSKISINRAKPIAMTFAETAQRLKKKMEELTQERIEVELYPLLPPHYHPGLLAIIKASVSRIIQRFEALD
jgi:predicted nucleotidyltransferase component of viral defense system